MKHVCAICSRPLTGNAFRYCSPDHAAEGRRRRERVPDPFAGELRKAIARRGSPRLIDLAAQTGLTTDAIGHLRRGLSRPSLRSAALLAEVLDWPALLALAQATRSRKCVVCERGFVTEHTVATRRVYCGERCQKLDWSRKANAQRARQRARVEKMAAFRLRDHQEAIAELCDWCEPEGICRNGECPVQKRKLSPLPFIPLSSVTRKDAA